MRRLFDIPSMSRALGFLTVALVGLFPWAAEEAHALDYEIDCAVYRTSVDAGFAERMRGIVGLPHDGDVGPLMILSSDQAEELRSRMGRICPADIEALLRSRGNAYAFALPPATEPTGLFAPLASHTAVLAEGGAERFTIRDDRPIEYFEKKRGQTYELKKLKLGLETTLTLTLEKSNVQGCTLRLWFDPTDVVSRKQLPALDLPVGKPRLNKSEAWTNLVLRLSRGRQGGLQGGLLFLLRSGLSRGEHARLMLILFQASVAEGNVGASGKPREQRPPEVVKDRSLQRDIYSAEIRVVLVPHDGWEHTLKKMPALKGLHRLEAAAPPFAPNQGSLANTPTLLSFLDDGSLDLRAAGTEFISAPRVTTSVWDRNLPEPLPTHTSLQATEGAPSDLESEERTPLSKLKVSGCQSISPGLNALLTKLIQFSREHANELDSAHWYGLKPAVIWDFSSETHPYLEHVKGTKYVLRVPEENPLPDGFACSFTGSVHKDTRELEIETGFWMSVGLRRERVEGTTLRVGKATTLWQGFSASFRCSPGDTVGFAFPRYDPKGAAGDVGPGIGYVLVLMKIELEDPVSM